LRRLNFLQQLLATGIHIKFYIESFMKDKGLTVSVEGKSIYDVTEVADGISAIVAIGQPQFTTDVPIIDGTASSVTS
jgi:hypothetical protein